MHIVTAPNFAGVERYVCTVANESAARGWETTVVGGHPTHMQKALVPEVRWLSGSNAARAVRSIARAGRHEFCHAHMTIAEAVAVATRPLHRAPVISTRHFAARRGSSTGGRLLAPWIARRLAREIAISDFVAIHLERPPDAVLHNAVPASTCLWKPASTVVLVLQRLEREKDTATALRAWGLSGLHKRGWTLRIIGDGSERPALERLARDAGLSGVAFGGWSASVAGEFANAGVLLAPAPAEPFGLSVLEAMAAGVPVVASAAGGHLETVGRLSEARLFQPGDADAAAAALRSLLPKFQRLALSASGRRVVEEHFTVTRHVDLLLREYELLRPAGEAARVQRQR